MDIEPVVANSYALGASTIAAKAVQLAPGLALAGFTVRYDRNDEIFGQAQPAEFVCKVISGAVRSTRLLSHGRRQIGAFHLAGDIFGLEHGATHRFSAEAVSPSQVALVGRAALAGLASRDGKAAVQLWSLTGRELEDLRDHLLLLGHKSAIARVGGFLLKLARRGGSNVLELPMSRDDIADHLGLTVETVSRALSQLVRDGAITMTRARKVVVRNPAALGSDCQMVAKQNSMPASTAFIQQFRA